ncbi:MAG: hypothetical protein ACI9F9_003039, partial [Candidatus Paceibacteria bacterium]
NIDRETSIDFQVDDIRELKLVPLPIVTRPKETPAPTKVVEEDAAAGPA